MTGRELQSEAVFNTTFCVYLNICRQLTWGKMPYHEFLNCLTFSMSCHNQCLLVRTVCLVTCLESPLIAPEFFFAFSLLRER